MTKPGPGNTPLGRVRAPAHGDRVHARLVEVGTGQALRRHTSRHGSPQTQPVVLRLEGDRLDEIVIRHRDLPIDRTTLRVDRPDTVEESVNPLARRPDTSSRSRIIQL